MEVDTDSELRQRIVELTDRIATHKAGQLPDYLGTPLPISQYHEAFHGPIHRATWWQPGPRLYRNRTLTLNEHSEASTPEDTHAGWIRRHGRHLQLINTSQQNRREQRHDVFQPSNYQSLHDRHTSSHKMAPHQVFVNEIRFLVADGGHKLIRADDETNRLHVTPKQAKVGDANFVRSKHGNLYKVDLVKTSQSGLSVLWLCLGRADEMRYRRSDRRKKQRPCQQFSTTGFCTVGPKCDYLHDADKVAMCKEYLQKGDCAFGEHCDLSHDPAPERVPLCLHFQRGSCTNPDCSYSHARVSPGASVCRDFATFGYCQAGSKCENRHVHECPDYANKGSCRNPKCRLPHVDRARHLRKAALNKNGQEDEDELMSDISSDVDYDSDDIDSDEDVKILGIEPTTHELSQQADFVHL